MPDQTTSHGGTASPVRLALDAPAKINLFLHVTGRRPDGYHLLESLVAFTEYGDTLVAEASDTLDFDIEGPFAAGLRAERQDNLVIRAARVLRAASGHRRGVHFHLDKRLPVASGIGGGSSDAAAALRLLAELWGEDPATEDFQEFALTLGADVPVCLAARPAMMTGIGDVVTPVAPLADCGVVLVNGGSAVPTPAVFKSRTGAFSPTMGWDGAESFDALVDLLEPRRNDLTNAAIGVSPVIADVLRALSNSDGCSLARLSGSGGTCFGLYPDRNVAVRAAELLSRQHPDWWVVATGFLSATPELRSA